MDVDTNPPFDWANDAFIALRDMDGHGPADEKWSAFSSTQSFPPAAFTIPPALVSQASIERYGQITPPDELSPAVPETDCRHGREGSVPVERLRNEVSWPVEQQIRSLANYQPEYQREPESQTQASTGRASKRRRTSSKQSSASQNQASPSPQQQPPPPPQQQQQQQQSATNPDPPKRKRGRPKSQPQIIEGFTADGFPFQVTSARQSHLEKNRVAAHKCRQRKKEYINSLEGRAREHSKKNKVLKENVAMLREEVLELKNEVLRHASCGFWAVDEYLARCAGDLLGMENPALASRTNSQMQTPTIANTGDRNERQMSIDSVPSGISGASPGDDDDDEHDFEGFDLVNDFDHEMDGVD